MSKTWDECNKLLGNTGFLSDPAVLESRVFGQSSEITPEQLLIGVIKVMGGLTGCVEVLAKEIDNLRARIDSDAA